MLSEIASIITIGEFIAEMLRKENDDAASDFNAFLEGIKKNRLMGRIV